MTDQLALGTLIAGRYRLGDRVGTGATAAVFVAHDERLDRAVAIKIIDAAAARTADPAAARRFVVEARTSARFVHPHAVAAYDAGTDDDRLFLVMELVPGGSLADRLDRLGPLTSHATAVLGAQIAGALGAAHATGIIHRDVKPANILLGADGNAKLADFGIARRFDEVGESLTSNGMVMGTRRYVSPEQANGDQLGPATDIFSLGVTLFEAVTLQRPPTVVERARDHRLDVRTIDPSIDPQLAAVIACATAMPVGERFATAVEMAARLSAAANATARGADGRTTPMPAGLRPVAAAAATATTVMPAGPPVAVPLPTTSGPTLVQQQLRAERRHRRRMMLVGGVAAAAVLAGVAVVVALGDDEPGTAVAPPASAVPATVATTANAPTTLAPTTLPPTTVPPTTVAPTTVPPTTLPPTTVPPTTAPPLVDVFPGLPGQLDLDAFLLALRFAPEFAGPRGDDLADGLENVREAPPGRRDDRADELRRDIEDWTNDDQLDPTVADAALDYLDELTADAENGRGRGND